MEIWTDEAKATCPNCKKQVIRSTGASCLDWCKYAKECVGDEIYNKYMKTKGEKNMLSKKMLEGLNEQINKEIYSAYFYLGMSAYAASLGSNGVANWFYIQWKEELVHTKKMFDYVHKQGERVSLKAIDEPPQDFSSVRDLFAKTLAHEKKVTGLINNLVDLARKENDKETEDFLQWFVKEQVEEEATPAGILDKLNQAGKDKKALTEIDNELAGRK